MLENRPSIKLLWIQLSKEASCMNFINKLSEENKISCLTVANSLLVSNEMCILLIISWQVTRNGVISTILASVDNELNMAEQYAVKKL